MANELTQTIDEQAEEILAKTETEVIAASPSATDGKTTPPSGEEVAVVPTLESVQAELEVLTKANSGLLTAVRSERTQRQGLQDKHEQITHLMSGVLARQEQAATAEEEPETSAPGNIPVQVNEAGDAFVEPTVFNKMIERQGETSEKRIQALEDQIADERAVSNQAAEFDKLVTSVVSEDTSYAKGYNELQKAYGWLNSEIVGWQNANRITGKISPGQALDIITDTEIEAEFNKAFPGVNVEKAIKAYESKRDLRNAIKDVMTEVTSSTTVKIDPKATKKLLAKASNLSEVQNQAQVKSGLTADTLAGMSVEEMEKIAPTAADLDKLWDIIERDNA